MYKILLLLTFALIACRSDSTMVEEKSFYKEVMMKGDVISSDANKKGAIYSVVKYQNELYKCFGGWHNWCTKQQDLTY